MKISVNGLLLNLLTTTVLLGHQIQSNAAVIVVNGMMTAKANFGSDFQVGDRFNYSFTFNDQAIDQSAETYNGLFNSAVSAFSLTRQASNLGTWDPAAGVFAVSPVRNFAINANGEEITLQVGGMGLPNVAGPAFFDVYLSYNWNSFLNPAPNLVRNFVDTGSGQTLAEIVGVSPLDFAEANASTSYGQIRRSGDFAGPKFKFEQTEITVIVPEPMPATLMLVGMVVATARKLLPKNKRGNGRCHPLPR